jgi:hypothetical protein
MLAQLVFGGKTEIWTREAERMMFSSAPSVEHLPRTRLTRQAFYAPPAPKDRYQESMKLRLFIADGSHLSGCQIIAHRQSEESCLDRGLNGLIAGHERTKDRQKNSAGLEGRP